uniref:Transmembrane protein n=1 Tax=Fagus sylvatica TaxID=28930 RepID=A0A2N9H4E6_FAGSY
MGWVCSWVWVDGGLGFGLGMVVSRGYGLPWVVVWVAVGLRGMGCRGFEHSEENRNEEREKKNEEREKKLK